MLKSKEEILHSHPIVSNRGGTDLFISLESARKAMDKYAEMKLHEYATRAQGLVDALKKIRNKLNGINDHVTNDIVAIVDTALQSWNQKEGV